MLVPVVVVASPLTCGGTVSQKVLADNDALSAFWIGNLKNKELDGSEVRGLLALHVWHALIQCCCCCCCCCCWLLNRRS